MSDHRIELPDDTRLWVREQLARIDQLQADADRRRQEGQIAPYLLRIEAWKAIAGLLVAGAAIFGAALALLNYLK